jgi:hypothetical protein
VTQPEQAGDLHLHCASTRAATDWPRTPKIARCPIPVNETRIPGPCTYISGHTKHQLQTYGGERQFCHLNSWSWPFQWDCAITGSDNAQSECMYIKHTSHSLPHALAPCQCRVDLTIAEAWHGMSKRRAADMQQGACAKAKLHAAGGCPLRKSSRVDYLMRGTEVSV